MLTFTIKLVFENLIDEFLGCLLVEKVARAKQDVERAML